MEAVRALENKGKDAPIVDDVSRVYIPPHLKKVFRSLKCNYTFMETHIFECHEHIFIYILSEKCHGHESNLGSTA